MNVSSSSRAGPGLPPADAHLVAEDSGYEILEGRLIAVPPAHEPHGERHSKVNALLEAFVTADYNVACDMLTRTSEKSDIAPDASVYPIARDPTTGGRQLEVLAFQVVATETLSHAAAKAVALTDRGVRRIFAIDVDRKRGLEWLRATGTWQVLADTGAIEDSAFVAPLPVEALVKAAKADDAVASALLAKRNPRLLAAQARVRDEGREQGRAEGREQGRAEGREQGRAEGRVEAGRRSLLGILEGRGLAPSTAARERIEACTDFDRLERWARRALHARFESDVFDDRD